jgi:predicted RNA-binding Zn-ribbon protein involved in translation (DUF1610 family)
MASEPCPSCETQVEVAAGEALDCPECGFVGDPDASTSPGGSFGSIAEGFDLDDEQRAWMRSARSRALKFAAVAAFALGLGFVLIGVGNGLFRLTDLGGPGGPGDVFGFLFHLVIAAVIIMLGATLLPVGLRLASRDQDADISQPAVLFAVLWLVVGVFGMLVGAPRQPGAVEGGIVLALSGIFGIIAVSSYDVRRTGPSITAGVLGLVAGGLLIGGAATVPGLIVNSARYGADLVFRFADPLHGAGLLAAILAAAVYPFVEASPKGRAGVLLGAASGGVLWGLGELVFAVSWLADNPLATFSGLDAGGSVAYGFVVAGGLATIVGGLAGFGAAIAAAGYTGLPLANLLGSNVASTSATGSRTTDVATWTCVSCGSTVAGAHDACPGCGHDPTTVCPDCEATIGPEASFCPECGSQIAVTAEVEE